MRGQKGFTVIEILIVTIICLMLVGIVAFFYLAYTYVDQHGVKGILEYLWEGRRAA